MKAGAPRFGPPPRARRPIRVSSYLLLYLFFAGVLIVTHMSLVSLPYFWDEAGQFIPATLDLMRDGAWIPHSTTPNIHPPAVPAYLAAVWRVAGFSPVSTRIAMLALSAMGVLAAFLLAVELTREARGAPAFLAAAMLCLSPVFFAQSMLAHLDAPAMLFTALALLLFVQNHIRSAAAACLALVLVKETGAVVPAVFALWLAKERRWRDAAWFLIPAAALAGWIVVLKRATGHWAGSDSFAAYNVWYPLQPLRMLGTFARRLYYLFGASFHWVGAAAMVWAWRKTPLFRSRAWQVAGLVAAAHVLMFTVLGGAVLNRYLLPVLPILFAAIAAAFSVLPRIERRVAVVVLLGGLGASNFINPPYPFPFEENLAFTDFLRLHRDAADYIAHWYEDPLVQTAWPMSAELSQPDLGFSPRKIRVQTLPDMTPETIAGIDWSRAQIVVVFSRNWDPRRSGMRLAGLAGVWEKLYDFIPNATAEEARARVPFPAEASFNRRGQWVDVYVNPELPRIPHRPAVVAAVGSGLP